MIESLEDQWWDHQGEWVDCRKCVIGKLAHRHVTGSGPNDAKVVFVGEGPGLSEDTLGMPFIGRSGRVLREAINAAGGRVDRCFFTNLVVCRPCDSRAGENRKPHPHEIQNCAPHLRRELELLQPRVILLCGRLPEMAAPAHSYWGQASELFRFIFHPAHVLRHGGVKSESFKEYIKAIEEGVSGRW